MGVHDRRLGVILPICLRAAWRRSEVQDLKFSLSPLHGRNKRPRQRPSLPHSQKAPRQGHRPTHGKSVCLGRQFGVAPGNVPLENRGFVGVDFLQRVVEQPFDAVERIGTAELRQVEGECRPLAFRRQIVVRTKWSRAKVTICLEGRRGMVSVRSSRTAVPAARPTPTKASKIQRTVQYTE